MLLNEVPQYTLYAITVISHRRDAVVRVGLSPSGRLAAAFLRRSGTCVIHDLDADKEVLRHKLHAVGKKGRECGWLGGWVDELERLRDSCALAEGVVFVSVSPLCPCVRVRADI